MDYLDFFYEMLCEQYVDIDICASLAKTCLTKYFDVYDWQARGNNGNSVPRGRAAHSLGSPVLRKRRVEEEFVEYRSTRRGRYVPDSELDAYLKEYFVSDQRFDILGWWKANANKYAVLPLMARDFLAIPLSTVSSESAFSLGGWLLGDNRSSMAPKTLEALVCGKDWLYETPCESLSLREGQQEQ